MKNNKGYLLLESIMSLVIIGTLLIAIYTSLIFCIKSKASIEDKVEIQQQALEISKHIKSTIEKSKGIISVTYNYENSNDNFKGITSIKNKEISYKKNSKKLFINTLNSKNQSESGGYEIGDYVESIYVYKDNNPKFLTIKLRLGKNNQIYENQFKVFIRNFEEEY
ncbi:MAG: hypothetical protein IJH34_05465 [Romboutsia sp.]|nr:hypothetical protein [Romboutsia sp.]